MSKGGLSGRIFLSDLENPTEVVGQVIFREREVLLVAFGHVCRGSRKVFSFGFEAIGGRRVRSPASAAD